MQGSPTWGLPGVVWPRRGQVLGSAGSQED